jgi:hypothetical protein
MGGFFTAAFILMCFVTPGRRSTDEANRQPAAAG